MKKLIILSFFMMMLLCSFVVACDKKIIYDVGNGIEVRCYNSSFLWEYNISGSFKEIVYDEENNIYLKNRFGGFTKLDSNGNELIEKSDSLSSPSSQYIAYYNNTLYIIESDSPYNIYIYNSSLDLINTITYPNNYSNSIYVDDSGIYVGEDDDILKFNHSLNIDYETTNSGTDSIKKLVGNDKYLYGFSSNDILLINKSNGERITLDEIGFFPQDIKLYNNSLYVVSSESGSLTYKYNLNLTNKQTFDTSRSYGIDIGNNTIYQISTEGYLEIYDLDFNSINSINVDGYGTIVYMEEELQTPFILNFNVIYPSSIYSTNYLNISCESSDGVKPNITINNTNFIKVNNNTFSANEGNYNILISCNNSYETKTITKNIIIDKSKPTLNKEIEYNYNPYYREINLFISDNFNISYFSLNCSNGLSYNTSPYTTNLNYSFNISNSNNTIFCDYVLNDNLYNTSNSFNIPFIYDYLKLNNCPTTEAERFYFILVLGIGLICFIAMFKVQDLIFKKISGVLGSLLFLFSSFTFAQCSSLYGYILILFSVVISAYVIFSVFTEE